MDCRNGLNWTLPKGANWKFRLWDENNNAWYNDEIYSVSGEDNDDLYFSYGNRPPSLTLSEEIEGWIPSGLKIMMIPDIIYPGREGLKLLQTKEKDNLTDIKKSDIFDDENREFYTRVRTVCEHFIEGYKQFTPSGGVSTKDSSTS